MCSPSKSTKPAKVENKPQDVFNLPGTWHLGLWDVDSHPCIGVSAGEGPDVVLKFLLKNFQKVKINLRTRFFGLRLGMVCDTEHMHPFPTCFGWGGPSKAVFSVFTLEVNKTGRS